MYFSGFLASFLLFIYIFPTYSVIADDPDRLFVEGDPIVILDSSNFNKNILQSQQTWFVNFYNSWCGHCIRFAPTWKSFGEDVSGKLSKRAIKSAFLSLTHQ